MGASTVRRLPRVGHQCSVHDVSPEAVGQLVTEGARGTGTLAELEADTGAHPLRADAETAPLRDPQYHPCDHIDLGDVGEVWRCGSVIGSWLLDPSAEAMHADSRREQFVGRVSDSGVERWTSITAIDQSASAPLLTAALDSWHASCGSRHGFCGSDPFPDQMQSPRRLDVEGHVEKPTQQ